SHLCVLRGEILGSVLSQIAALAPEALGGRVQWHFEVSFQSVSYHCRKRQGPVMGPRDAFLAFLQRPAKVGDDPVGRICIRVNRPAAKIERRDVSMELGKVCFCDRTAAETGLLDLYQDIFVEG